MVVIPPSHCSRTSLHARPPGANVSWFRSVVRDAKLEAAPHMMLVSSLLDYVDAAAQNRGACRQADTGAAIAWGRVKPIPRPAVGLRSTHTARTVHSGTDSATRFGGALRRSGFRKRAHA